MKRSTHEIKGGKKLSLTRTGFVEGAKIVPPNGQDDEETLRQQRELDDIFKDFDADLDDQ